MKRPRTPFGSRPQWITLAGSLLGVFAQGAWACEGPAAKLASIEGRVEIRAAGANTWQAATALQAVCTGDTIAVRPLGRAAVVLPNDVLLRLDQGSVLTLKAFAPDQPSELGLLQGALHVLTRFSKRFGVVTPYMNAMVDGTEFTVQIANEATSVSVNEGQVRAENSAGQQTLTAGLSARAAQGQAPTALTLRPLDAVQWALYFPQIASIPSDAVAALPEAAQSSARQAAQGQYSEALSSWPAEFNALPAQRAGWLLGVGRVSEAEALLKGDESAAALAVGALIQVVRNQTKEALATAQRAIAADSHSAAAHLALSYARQSLRDLPGALGAVQQAVQLEPTHTLAWARLAELQLSGGQLRDGEASAQRALALNPQNPRATTLLGFAQLLRGQTAQAQASLQQAQALAPSDPLPHLGLGLALLRQGQAAQGRRELEIAVMLDPGDAELRSLLARAYMGEQRDGLAATELSVAKGLDPLSPTPWFVDGLRKQSNHRPLEAAQDYERALALNQNRAVVRPNGLLDTDRAARTAALASVWRELGFEVAMLAAARNALVDDPQSEAAHRLLAQAYASSPRYETARVSELLQTQLRQSPRTEPVAPQELVPGLPVLNGPRALALQETGPLFGERQRGARLGLMGGSQGLLASSATAWHQLGDGQISLGHFHYEFDGYQPGANTKLDTNNVLWQTALTPEFTVQAEVRSSRREGGDITQRLIPESSAPVRNRGLNTDMQRVGLRYAPVPESEWLGSLIWNKKDSVARDVTTRGPLTFTSEGSTAPSAQLSELSHSTSTHGHHWLAGLSEYREDYLRTVTTSVRGPVPPRTNVVTSSALGEHHLGFGYAALNFSPWTLHLGLSHDDLARGALAVHQTSPKLGARWQATEAITLRWASIRVVKGFSTKEQSIEPTQFAGFNQVFDDLDGTQSKRLALAMDLQPDRISKWSLEISRRNLSAPSLVLTPSAGCPGPVCSAHWKESLNQLSGQHLLGTQWALNYGVVYESQALDGANAVVNVPSRIRTWQLPASVTYFSKANWSLVGSARGVRQSVHTNSGPVFDASETFVVIDGGLRFPLSPRAHLRFDGFNLLNRKFRYQDTYLSGEPRVPMFQPQRMMILRVEIRV